MSDDIPADEAQAFEAAPDIQEWFARPKGTPDPNIPRPRTATTYQIMSAFTDADWAAYTGVKASDQRLFTARDKPWPEDNPKVARIADKLGVKPASLFDRALGAGA